MGASFLAARTKRCASQTTCTFRSFCEDIRKKGKRKREKGERNKLRGKPHSLPFAFLLLPSKAMPKSTRSLGFAELRVGLLVLIAIAILIFLILNASGDLNPFASHLHLH